MCVNKLHHSMYWVKCEALISMLVKKAQWQNEYFKMSKKFIIGCLNTFGQMVQLVFFSHCDNNTFTIVLQNV